MVWCGVVWCGVVFINGGCKVREGREGCEVRKGRCYDRIVYKRVWTRMGVVW